MKNYRDNELKCLLIVLSALILMFGTELLSGDVDGGGIITIAGSVLFTSVISLSAFLLDCSVGTQLKNKLVGLFFIRLPGEKVFSRIKNDRIKDARFLLSDAKERYFSIIEKIPDGESKYKYENAKWYRIYKKYENDGSITQSQRDYLACRDMFVTTVSFTLLYIVACTTSVLVIFSWKLILVLGAILVLTNIAAHVKMNRFVNAVIATDIAKKLINKEDLI